MRNTRRTASEKRSVSKNVDDTAKAGTLWKRWCERMKKRSNFAVMKNLIHLVKPLTDYMILAILMGLLGHLCASFITIFGAFGILQVLGMWKGSVEKIYPMKFFCKHIFRNIAANYIHSKIYCFK